MSIIQVKVHNYVHDLVSNTAHVNQRVEVDDMQDVYDGVRFRILLVVLCIGLASKGTYDGYMDVNVIYVVISKDGI